MHLKNKSLLAAPFIHLLMLLLLFSKKISAKMCFPNIELGLICYVFKLKVHNPHSTLMKKRCMRNLQLSLLTTMLMVMMMAVMKKEEWERWAQATNEAMRR